MPRRRSCAIQPVCLQTNLGSQLSDMERRQTVNRRWPLDGPGPLWRSRLWSWQYKIRQMARHIDNASFIYADGNSRWSILACQVISLLHLCKMPTPASAASNPSESALDTLRENVYSVGPIDAYRNALNNRPNIPLTQPFAGRDDTPRLSEMQSPMMQHPEFPKFVDLMKRSGNESAPAEPRSSLQNLFNNYLKQVYN